LLNSEFDYGTVNIKETLNFVKVQPIVADVQHVANEMSFRKSRFGRQSNQRIARARASPTINFMNHCKLQGVGKLFQNFENAQASACENSPMRALLCA
jgi:hypothetical protein